MPAIPHPDADRYLERPSRDHFIFLLFGGDQGLIYERSRKLIRSFIGRSNNPMQLTDFSGDQIAADPLTLVDEANSIGLFGEARRAIRISVGLKSPLPALELVARAPPADCAIILQAGELKRDAALRKWIEKQPFGASIECRPDEARDIQRLIDTELRTASLSIEPDARDALGAKLGENRLSTRAEIEKLILYSRGQESITLECINNILHDASALGINAAAIAIFSGNSNLILELLTKATQLGAEIGSIIGAATRYALNLHRCRVEIERGADFTAVLDALLRQTNGYSRKAMIADHLRRISTTKIASGIDALYDVTRKLRKNNILGEEYATSLFLSLPYPQS